MALVIPLSSLGIAVILTCWLWFRPAPSKTAFVVQCLAGFVTITAGWLGTIWTAVPRWTMVAVLVLWLVAAVRAVRRRPRAMRLRAPGRWATILVSMTLILIGGWALSQALLGQRAPSIASINLRPPLDGNDIVVANGGSRLLINAHQDMLNLSVPKHRLWQGQSYGIDLVGLNALGVTASGILPTDPAR